MSSQIVCVVVKKGQEKWKKNQISEKNLRKVLTDTIEGWKKGGVVALNLAQVSFSNWSAGGQNSISANGLVSLYARLKKGDKSLQFGVIAQDVEKYFPDAVSVDNNGFKGVNYRTLSTLTMAKAQTQQKEIEELREALNELIEKVG